MKIDKIYLVPHFHFDFEWWKEEPYHEQDTFVIIDEAMRMLHEYPEFTYVIDSVLPLKQYIENKRGGLETLKEYIRQERVEIVGGDIVAPDEVIPTGEALIRQFEEGQEWLKEVFDIEVKVGWGIDAFAHPARMPQILTSLGFKYFVFARGVKPFDSMHPTLFNWKDPAGQSELLSYWWAAHYEGCIPKKISSGRSRKRTIRNYFKEMESRIDFEGSRSPVPWLMIPLGGDFVIPNSTWIDFVNEWNSKKEVQLEFSLPSKYFERVKDAELPGHTGLFPHVFDGYFTSREKSKQASRSNANRLCGLEKLISLSGIHGYKSEPQEVKEAWWEVLKGDFHDTIAGTGTDRVYRRTMQRYARAEALIGKSETHLTSFLETVLKEKSTYVFNPLNWEREELIRLNGVEKLMKVRPLSCEQPELIDKRESDLIITDSSLESELLKIEINQDTGALSIYDKEYSFYPILNGANHTSIIDDAGNLWVTRSINKNYPVKLKAVDIVKRSSFSGVIRITEENGFVSIKKEIELNSFQKRVNFKTEIDFTGKDKRIDMSFPFTFDGEWISENVLHAEKVSEGIYPVQNFALFEGENYKAAIVNRGIPGYFLEKNTGKIMLMRSVSMFSWSLVRWVLRNIIPIASSLKEASVYLRKKLNIIEFPVYPIHHLFLREFASEGSLSGHGALDKRAHREARLNFNKESLAWERGKHSFQYALVLDVKDIAGAVRAGQEINNPLWQMTIEGKGSHESIQLLSEEVKDIIITSVVPYKKGWRIRMYEPQGKKAVARLAFGFHISKAYVLRGAEAGMTALEIKNDEIEFRLDPNELVQIYIER